MTTALYPGSFDPATNGHIDIACRAATIFDHLVIGVFDVPSKNVLFPTEARVEMFSKAMERWPNVTVKAYKQLTIGFAMECGASILVRGIRAMTDFEYELQMALMNRKLAPGIETICFMTSQEYSFLSSSIVKDVARLHGSIANLVPPHVQAALVDAYKDRDDDGSIPRYLTG